MSGLNCVRKTNQQMFGWLGGVLTFAGTARGIRAIAYHLVVLCIISMELGIGVWLAGIVSPPFGNWNVLAAGCIVIVTALVCAGTLIYGIVLWDNCKEGST